jgi:hypothetical protein
MPDQGDAVFTEVLQLNVDTDQFAAQMKEVERIYAASLENMPNLDKVSSVNITESIKQLNDTIAQISKGAADVLVNLAEVTTESASTMSTQMSEMASSVSTSLSQVTTALTQVRQQQQQTTQGGQALNTFWGGFTSNIARSAGSLLKSVIIYKAFNEALSLSADLILAPFKAIQEGYKYLENVQERSSIIQAALLQSVQFSKNWGDNVRIAGQEADYLVRKVDDFATKLHVSSQSIQTGLTTFLEYGGANLTKSLDDAVGVSAIVTGALQSQNPQLEARKLIAEVQKLVQGATTDSSKLAAALGLSKEQLNGMVEHAKKYHDLYQEILAFSPGITERLGEANSRQVALVATLDLYKERWEALIAGPLFERFTKILQDVLGWLDKHEDQMRAIGVQLGLMIDGAAEFVQKFVSNNWEGIVDTFKILAKFAAEIGAQFAFLLQTVLTIAEVKSKLDGDKSAGFLLPTDKLAESYQHNKELSDLQKQYGDGLQGVSYDQYESKKKAINDKYEALQASEQKAQAQTKTWGEILTDAKNGFNDASHAVDKFEQQVDNLGKTSAAAKAGQRTEPGWSTIHGINTKAPKTSGSDLHSDMAEWRQEIKNVESGYDDLKDKVKDALATATISHQQAADQIKQINKSELSAVDDMVTQYEDAAKRVKGAKAEQIKSAIVSLKNLREQLANELDHQQNANQTAADREVKDVQHLADQGQLRLIEDARKAAAAADQDAFKSGRSTAVDAFDAETQRLKEAYQERDSILSAESLKFGKEGQQALNELNLADQQFTEEMAARTRERIQLVEQERLAREAYAVKMSQLDIDRKKDVAAGQSSLSFGGGSSASEQALELQRNRQILALEIQLTDVQLRNAAANLAEAQAKNQNSEATRKLAEEVRGLENQRIQQGVQAIQAAGAGINNPAIRNQAQQTEANNQTKKLTDEITHLTVELARLTAKLNATTDPAQGAAISKQIDSTKGQISSDQNTLSGIQQASDQLKTTLTDAAQNLRDSIFGSEWQQDWRAAQDAFKNGTDAMDTLTGAVDAAASGLSAFAHAGSSILGAINQYSQGQKQGGVLGGIGSLLSSGPVSDALSMIPVVGAIVKPLGQAFEFIGEMFKAQAQKIADQIEKAINQINQNYSDGAATLNQTIVALQEQREEMISQLSGVKDGEEQLAKLLPQIDNEISGLENQVKQIEVSFNNSLFALSQGGQALTQWVQTWQQINQQVAQYIEAGGSIAEANEYLNEQLAQQQLNLQNQLNQGQQQAIQDALQLNQLQTQKIDLIKQEQATEFGIETQDAIEKRTSAAVSTAISLQQQRDQFSQQLQDLQSQLDLTQQKVKLESQIFNLAQGTAALEAQSNQLTLESLQQQLANYQQIQQILKDTAGFQFNSGNFNTNNPYIPGYGFTGTGAQPPTSGTIGPAGPGYGSGTGHGLLPGPGSGPAPSPVQPLGGANPGDTYNITIQNTNGDAIDGQKFASYLAKEIQNQARTGRSTF